jgi:hypothetical protein
MLHRKNRGNRVTSRFVFLTIALFLAACDTSQPQAQQHWNYYDECAQHTSSFLAMAECGKTSRNAVCQALDNCSATGNAFVSYTDSLAASVKNGQMTEAEAQRQWIGFRTSQSYVTEVILP